MAQREVGQGSFQFAPEFNPVQEETVGGAETFSFALQEDMVEAIRVQQEAFAPRFNKYMGAEGQDPFFLAPETYRTLVSLIPLYFDLARERLDQGDTLEGWELRNIGAISGKAIIPDSIAPTMENARRVGQDVERFQKGAERVRIRELCTGAGLSTVMTWREIMRNREGGLTIVTSDNALESIVASALLLSSQGIPYRIVGAEVPDELLSFDGVVLQYMDVGRAVAGENSRGFKYDYVVTDHGVSYFPEQIHDRVVGNALEMLNGYGAMYVCGLEPDVTVELDYPKMIKEIMLGGGTRRREYEAIRAERAEDVRIGDRDGTELFYDVTKLAGDRVAVTAFYTQETGGLYDMLHGLLLGGGERNFGEFLGYIKAIVGVVRTTKELGGEIQSPVAHSLEFARSQLGDGATYTLYPPYEEGKRVARTVRIQVNQ